ncbi:peptidoglycan-binding protein [Candidatus Parcubacteria bacterium]|nr:MAG: peptidoglycan-binding protein [Candidatus Parcubacteria bacterium]
MGMALQRQYILLVIGLTLLFVPSTARAITTAEIDAQINLLVEQITILQNKIQQYPSTPITPMIPVQTAVPTQTSGSVTRVCPVIGRTLSLGMNGADVRSLQDFLSHEELFPKTSINGYFDLQTQQAVQTWQASHGIVSSGTVGTTGYGAVGPRTRTLIQLNCSLGPKTTTLTPRTANDPVPTSCPVAPRPITSCSSGWKAVTDYYGCTTSYTCSTSSSGNSSNTTSSSGNTQFSVISPVQGLTIRGGNFLYISWNPGNVASEYLGLELITETGLVARSIAVLPSLTATTYYLWTVPGGIYGVSPGRYKVRASLQTAGATYCATTPGCSVFKTAESGIFTIQ